MVGFLLRLRATDRCAPTSSPISPICASLFLFTLPTLFDPRCDPFPRHPSPNQPAWCTSSPPFLSCPPPPPLPLPLSRSSIPTCRCILYSNHLVQSSLPLYTKLFVVELFSVRIYIYIYTRRISGTHQPAPYRRRGQRIAILLPLFSMYAVAPADSRCSPSDRASLFDQPRLHRQRKWTGREWVRDLQRFPRHFDDGSLLLISPVYGPR